MMMLRTSVPGASMAASRRSAAAPVRRVVCFVQPPPSLGKEIKEAITQAEETCADPKKAKECMVQWDTVEELSAAQSHMKQAYKDDATKSDPLEEFCKSAPDADECRVYED